MPPTSDQEWIKLILDQISQETRQNSVKLDTIATNCATREDLRELRQEIISNYVTLSVYHAGQDEVRRLSTELSDLKKDLDAYKQDNRKEIEEAKKLTLNLPEKLAVAVATLLAIISALVTLFEHIKIF